VLGSSMETWKTGCTACIVVGRQSVQDRGPTWLMMSKGPRYFSESFFEGQVVQKNFAFTKALSLLGSGSRVVDSGLRRWILKGLGLSLCAVPS
jgi:hypothetical protein